MRDSRRNQNGFANFKLHDAAFALHGGTTAKLKINQIVIGSPRQLLLTVKQTFDGDPQSVAFPNRYLYPVSRAGRAPKQVERTNFRHHSLPHASRANDRCLVSFHPDMFVRIPVGHELAYFFAHNTDLLKNLPP